MSARDMFDQIMSRIGALLAMFLSLVGSFMATGTERLMFFAVLFLSGVAYRILIKVDPFLPDEIDSPVDAVRILAGKERSNPR